jgi:hypothetical protein
MRCSSIYGTYGSSLYSFSTNGGDFYNFRGSLNNNISNLAIDSRNGTIYGTYGSSLYRFSTNGGDFYNFIGSLNNNIDNLAIMSSSKLIVPESSLNVLIAIAITFMTLVLILSKKCRNHDS